MSLQCQIKIYLTWHTFSWNVNCTSTIEELRISRRLLWSSARRTPSWTKRSSNWRTRFGHTICFYCFHISNLCRFSFWKPKRMRRRTMMVVAKAILWRRSTWIAHLPRFSFLILCWINFLRLQIVESELKFIELEYAKQHVNYLKSFLPDNFTKAGGESCENFYQFYLLLSLRRQRLRLDLRALSAYGCEGVEFGQTAQHEVSACTEWPEARAHHFIA